jgi:hypothetical protein
MKLVLYNDYQLGVLVSNRVVDAMAALAGQAFRRPQDLIEMVIIEWAALRAKIAAATQGKDGVPLDSVKLQPLSPSRRKSSAPQSTTWSLGSVLRPIWMPSSRPRPQ